MNDELIEEAWTLPDWAPKDAGATLFQDGDWVFVRDYKLESHEPFVTVVHLCNGGEWRSRQHPPQLINKHCDTCNAEAPDSVLGFTSLTRWDR